jgi:hypothetical protein
MSSGASDLAAAAAAWTKPVYATTLSGGPPRYPLELGVPGPFAKWVKFSAMSGRHIGRVGFQNMVEWGAPDKPEMTVALYVPETALRTDISAAYDTTDIGAFVGAVSEFTAQTNADFMGGIARGISRMGAATQDMANSANTTTIVETLKTVGSVAGSAIDGLWTAGGELYESVKRDSGNLLSQAAFAGILNAASNRFPGATGQVTGLRVNQRTDVLFNHMEYRTHDFDYLLIPRSEKEAESIDLIIHMFQFYMLPSYSPDINGNVAGTMIGFPYEFDISFWTEDQPTDHHINKIGRSVLTSVGIDHAAAGTVAFYKGASGVYPAATKLSLKFMEVKLLARDSVEINRGPKNPSNTYDPIGRPLNQAIEEATATVDGHPGIDTSPDSPGWLDPDAPLPPDMLLRDAIPNSTIWSEHPNNRLNPVTETHLEGGEWWVGM